MAELTPNASTPDCMFGTKVGGTNCKSPSREDAGTSPLNPHPKCPQCGSKRLWKDGTRIALSGGLIQRWLCRDCSFRFSDPNDVERAREPFDSASTVETKSLKTAGIKVFTCQICATNKEAKNLETTTETKTVAEMNKDVKGILVQYEAKMLLEGYGAETIRGAVSCLRALIARNADLMNPESVKKALSIEESKKEKNEKGWSQNRRRNVINAYTLFLKFQKSKLDKTKMHRRQQASLHPSGN